MEKVIANQKTLVAVREECAQKSGRLLVKRLTKYHKAVSQIRTLKKMLKAASGAEASALVIALKGARIRMRNAEDNVHWGRQSYRRDCRMAAFEKAQLTRLEKGEFDAFTCAAAQSKLN